MLEFFIVIGLIILIAAIARPSPEAKQRKRENDAKIVCPHCQERGFVTTAYPVEIKRGISGGKTTGAILTGGLSLLATGLSRKEWVTQAHCSNCNQTWQY